MQNNQSDQHNQNLQNNKNIQSNKNNHNNQKNKIVDARGLSCPEPVMLARKAIQESGKGIIEIMVDSGTARDNVSRMGKNSGWSVKVEDQNDGFYKVLLQK